MATFSLCQEELPQVAPQKSKSLLYFISQVVSREDDKFNVGGL